MSALRVVDGVPDPKSVDALSREELREWIGDRLHGRDALVPSDARQGELPHALFARFYPELGRGCREDMRWIVTGFVVDMARKPNSRWRGDAADELLLLAQEVCDREELQYYLVEMVSSRFLYLPGEIEHRDDLHFRALQSLVALGWRGSKEFWYEQASLSPDRFAGVAFDGLALVSASAAIGILPRVPWTGAVEDEILTSLPDLLEVYGVPVVVWALEQHLPDAGPETYTAICRFLESEQIILPALRVPAQRHRRARAWAPLSSGR